MEEKEVVTIFDVANKAKVSLSTVSRVTNHPDKVNPATRDKVLQVIKDLGYHPNAIAKGLASRHTTTVGIVLSDVTRAATANLLGGIIDIAKQFNYSIKLFSMLGDVDVLESFREVLAEQVDGIIFMNDELETKQMDEIKELASKAVTPIVLANVYSEADKMPSVMIDYEDAAYKVTKELIEKGKKDIYMLTTVRKYSINIGKVLGYEKAMKEAGLEPLVFRTSGDVSINSKHFQEFFNNRKVDAALAVRDSIAISFMNEMQNKGLRVPEDISVIGFQNTKYAILSRPTLTCIDNSVYDIGAVAMRLLTKLMLPNEEEVKDTHIILPYRVVKRQSM